MYWTTSSGKIELQITKAEARSASHQGQCDMSVLALSEKPRIKKQLNKIDKTILATELSEYGAWSEIELADHAQNLQRLLWLACTDINEENL